MEAIAQSLYTVALRDAPTSLPVSAKISAETRYARELERALGGPEQVAAALDAIHSLEGADDISAADKALAERWQKAVLNARDRALAQIGEAEDAYFEVRLG